MYNETTGEWFKDYKIEKEIRHKENKTEMEILYLQMIYYNSIACEINIDYSKKHINEDTYNKERLKNKKEYILIYDECANIDTKIRNRIRINRKISNFEQMFIKEFNELQDNYVKDIIIYLSTVRG